MATRQALYLTKLFGLQGKVAFVTGAARGIGLEMSRGLASAGCKVAMADVNVDAVAKASEELNEELAEAATIGVGVEVTDKSSVQEMVSLTVDTFGGLDVAVNNAGIAFSGEEPKHFAENCSEEEWQRTLDINTKGVFFGCQLAAKHFMAHSVKGSIINTASMCARSGAVLRPQKQVAYNASKAAVVQMSRCMAVEWATHNIRVNTISPGYIYTELNRGENVRHMVEGWALQTPMQRLAECHELVGALLYLASNNASSFTTASDLLVDGAYTVW